MTTLQGISRASLTADLKKVPVHLNHRPAAAIDLDQRFGPKVSDYMRAYHGSDFSYENDLHRLPVEAYRKLSIDEACKVAMSAKFSLSSDTERTLNENPTHMLVYKIRSSMWRWGYRRAPWNEIVDAYDGLRAFDFYKPGFDITIDHTTSVHERGYSAHTDTFLDGVFAFLVHYKGEHVMTIGFSVIAGRKILLQQVQLKQARGNRWLFRLPANRIEFIVDCLHVAFPTHEVMIADGADIATSSLDSYRRGLESAQRMKADYERRLANATDDNRTDLERFRDKITKEASDLALKIAKLEADLPRLAAFYRESGRYSQGKALHRNGITHYALAA